MSTTVSAIGLVHHSQFGRIGFMYTGTPPAGRISTARLAHVLGHWRRGGARAGTRDLAAAIELQIVDGQLPVGTRLPAEREMARALGVSRTLVATAMERLRERDLLASRQGSGTWVTGGGGNVPAGAVPADSELIDFARASPPAASGVLEAFDRARSALPVELADHGYSDRGLPELRERIAARYTARGLPTDAEQIVVTNGAHHAFVLTLRTLAGPGDRVLVEQPTYPNVLDAVRAAHLIGVPVPVDPDDGWDIPGIAAALRQSAPRLAYFIADFHNPTGLRLDGAGRDQLGAVLRNQRTPAVVDETFAELDMTAGAEEAPAPLAAFAGDWAITIGSAAKTYWGGLRLGWIRAPASMIGRILSARSGLDLGSPVLEQLALTELLADPEPVLRERRADMREHRDILVDHLAARCPDWSFRIPSGGLSLWCRLPEAMSTRLAVAAGNEGLQVAPGPRFGVHGGLERWLRVPFTLPADRLTEAVRRLGVAAASIRGPAAAAVPDAVNVPVS